MVSWPLSHSFHITNVQHHSCLAHIINLATQALLAAHSKSKHYDPTSPEDIVVATHDGFQRDEVGLIRAIAVKVSHSLDNCWSGPKLFQTQEQSSAQRKELFQRVQLRSHDGHTPRNPPLQLVLDMKVRWSSLFVMLHCALDLMEVSHFSSSDFYHLTSLLWQEIIYFIQMLEIQEQDAEKRHKIQDLELTEDEWQRVQLLLSLLAVGHHFIIT